MILMIMNEMLSNEFNMFKTTKYLITLEIYYQSGPKKVGKNVLWKLTMVSENPTVKFLRQIEIFILIFLDSGNELSEGDEEAMETEDQEPDQDENDQPDEQKSVSVIHILAKRQKLIEENKIQIGSMATNFLENPEERMFLLDRLIR